jgi:hypothetical protein
MSKNVKLCQFVSIYVKLCQKMYQPTTNLSPDSKKQPKTQRKKIVPFFANNAKASLQQTNFCICRLGRVYIL